MFRKFDATTDVVGSVQLKSSVQKGIRNRVVELYPQLTDYIDTIIPKKDTIRTVKCKDHIELVVSSEGRVLFVKSRDIDYIPTLHLLHQYPFMMQQQQVDRGAIRFVLSGAHIMCPGLTSPGARMTPELPSGTLVAIIAEAHQHAIAIGLMKMSTDETRKVNKGIAIETIHCLNDGLWHTGLIK